ncbi:hypothetical protein VTL71DRAFT_6486 [Oculimacula yallundae]|uniref:Uncharacterized protein n=1 Tax=Oculimacula yallundae TaxID=86028 RepID=A0ABR4BX40_9HELO
MFEKWPADQVTDPRPTNEPANRTITEKNKNENDCKQKYTTLRMTTIPYPGTAPNRWWKVNACQKCTHDELASHTSIARPIRSNAIRTPIQHAHPRPCTAMPYHAMHPRFRYRCDSMIDSIAQKLHLPLAPINQTNQTHRGGIL